MYVWSVFSHVRGWPWIEGIWEQGAEENVLSKEREIEGWIKLHTEELPNVFSK
jgi:hypothetical protein